jgi:hypothetical protein
MEYQEIGQHNYSVHKDKYRVPLQYSNHLSLICLHMLSVFALYIKRIKNLITWTFFP